MFLAVSGIPDEHGTHQRGCAANSPGKHRDGFSPIVSLRIKPFKPPPCRLVQPDQALAGQDRAVEIGDSGLLRGILLHFFCFY